MQKRAEKTKLVILKSARKLFAARGYHGTSVDDIAASADVNKQRIYAYFGGKSGLFEACLVDAYDDIAANDEALLALDESKIPEFAGIVLSHYLESHERRPDFWRLVAWANMETEDFTKCLENIKEKSFSHLRGLYEKGRADGFFPAETSFETYIFSLMAVSFFYFSNRRTLGKILPRGFFSKEGRGRLVLEFSDMLGFGKVRPTRRG